MEKMDNSKKYRFYGLCLYYFIHFLNYTFSYIRIENEGEEKVREATHPYIFCFWHEKLLSASLAMRNLPKKVGLASPSKDGELIAVPLEKMGFDMVRGSSDKQSVSSLLSLLKFLKKGYSMGTPVDGPKGPPYKVKLGLLYLAQKSGVPIVPMGGAFTKKWIFSKTWDHFQVPKPFSKILYVLGDPISLKKNTNLKEMALFLEEEINNLNEKAERLVREGNYE